MKKFAAMLCVVWLMIVIPTSFANDITVSSVSLENQNLTDHYCIVQFNLNWDNSWRTTGIPQNWDAAWLFVKFRVGSDPWQHATLAATGSVAPGGSTIDFTGSTGALIYRDSDGSGTNNWIDVGLRWNYGADGVADDAQVEVRVFAIEMVYVPQGSFYLGDGAADGRFYPYGDDTQPFLVDGSAITCSGITAGNLCGSGTGTGMYDNPVPSTYPTGYNAFYCMKYEISQEQFVDFLNTLTRDQQQNHTTSDVSGDVISAAYEFVLSGTGVVFARNGISCPLSGNGTVDPITFFCNYNDNATGNESGDGQNIACNYLRWDDVAAYADWAGLRPMTEAEYEKASRGPNNPVGNEYAYGTASYSATTYTMTNAGYPHEEINNMGTNIGNMATSLNMIVISGPARCGIFAAGSANHTRVETGASYYGIMELSGNLMEMTVCMLNLAGLSFTGLHGDGVLTTNGMGNTDYWPGINANFNYNTENGVYSTNGCVADAGLGQRGESFDGVFSGAQVSDRVNAGTTNNVLMRFRSNGARLVRTAP